ncbi:VWA domain-containing protein [Granulicella sp. WH15]|uniref:VWA domain-containing protein n=1 Tax=Granulicella sp. WH15 TaxID=2602070 RepID=UPI0013670A99|nr:VWA domain-containing protein [Granulicella sp. WH15]QHN02415.1 VWA domain-containing protein [Granulicella sp. WH15]
MIAKLRFSLARCFSVGLALSVVCLAAHAQAAKPATADSSAITTISTQARLVNLPVVVRDKKGGLIHSLTKDDFVLKVDAKPQVIRYFDQDANLPLTLGLLVDISESQRSVIDEERTASSAFLDKMLAPDRDKAFVVQFGSQTELLQDLTSSRPKLQQALKEIGSTSGSSSNDDDSNSRSSRRGTVLYDAAFLAADEVMKPVKGRKALILLTDGGDRNSRETLNKAIEAAQRADTIIYAIYFKGEEPHQDYNNNGRQHGGGYPGGGYPGGGYPGGGYPGGGGRFPGGGRPSGGGGNNLPNRVDGKKILSQMAAETGGRMFEGKKNNLADIYGQIGEELRAQYRLGYTPDADMASDGYHQIDLTLKDAKKGYTVQTRDGYYTGK